METGSNELGLWVSEWNLEIGENVGGFGFQSSTYSYLGYGSQIYVSKWRGFLGGKVRYLNSCRRILAVIRPCGLMVKALVFGTKD